MKKLSKVLSVICALVLVASLGVTAFAADVGGGESTLDENDKVTGNVYVTAGTGSVDRSPIYLVTIELTDLDFTYNPEKAEGKWDTDELRYPGYTKEGWDMTGIDISITNKSNAGVKITPSFETLTNFDDFVVTFTKDGSAALDNGALTLTTADNNPDKTLAGTPVDGKIHAAPGGTIDTTKLEGRTQVATVTLTVAAAD